MWWPMAAIALGLQLHSDFEVSLGYNRGPFLKTKQSKQTNRTLPGELNHLNKKDAVQDQRCHSWSLVQNNGTEK